MTMTVLDVKEVHSGYGSIPIIQGVSLSVGAGELVALLGSNGAGKTTLLRTIGGLATRMKGTILFNGTDVSRLPAHELARIGVGHVLEGRQLFPFMTVKQNLMLGAYRRAARARASDSLDWVLGLFPVLKRRLGQLAGTLSGGEQQMLAIARTLMLQPKLLLVDEPSLGLAPRVVQTVFDALRRVAETGVAVLAAEQNVPAILRMADRAYVMERGRLVLQGRADALLESDEVKKAYLGVS